MMTPQRIAQMQAWADKYCCTCVLPKGHGRLGDISKIETEYRRNISLHMSDGEMLDLLCGIIDDAPTVIEADKGEEE